MSTQTSVGHGLSGYAFGHTLIWAEGMTATDRARVCRVCGMPLTRRGSVWLVAGSPERIAEKIGYLTTVYRTLGVTDKQLELSAVVWPLPSAAIARAVPQ